MKIEITDSERQVLVEMLEAAYKEELHGLHHTDTDSFRQLLKRHIATLEGLRAKLSQDAVPPG